MDEDVEADLAKIDALYEGFPEPSAWTALDVDMSAWDDAAAALAEVRANDPTLADQLRDRAFREAGVDTGAIEGLYTTDRGFTMTVADSASLDEAARFVRENKGADVEALFRAQVEGYEMALDLVAQDRPLTETWIRQLHEVITGPQETYDVITPQGPNKHRLPKGEYKNRPNHVRQPDGTTFAYAPVMEVGPEMARFVAHANADVVAAMHPVVAAAWLHYALVRIHPFADGNGRVTRAVASLPLLRAASIPFKVPADRRYGYLAALEAADVGRATELLRFVREETTSGMRLLAAHTRPRSRRSEITVRPDGPPIGRYVLTAKRLQGLALEAVEDQIDARGRGRVRPTAHQVYDQPVPDGWIDPSHLDDAITGFGIRKDEVGVIRIVMAVRILLASELGRGADLLLTTGGRGLDEVFSIDEIDPVPTQTFRSRIQLWAAAVYDEALLAIGG